MASENDRLGVQVGFEFESEQSILPKVKNILDKISKNTNVDVNFNVDKNKLDSILAQTAKISNTSIILDKDGNTLKSITEINTGLSQTLKLIETSKGQQLNISNNFAKDEKMLLEESVRLLQQEYQIKTALLTAEGNYKNILNEQLTLNQKIQNAVVDDSTSNRLLAEKVRLNEQYLQSVAKVQDKKDKQAQKDKAESIEMQKLIALEKQRLNNKLALYKVRYKGNEDVEALNKTAQAIENLGDKSNNLKEVRNEIKALSQEIQNMEIKTKVSTSNITKHDDLSFINNHKANVMGLSSYFLNGDLLSTMGNTFRQATDYVIELDSAMTDLKKVTDETEGTYKNFLGTAHEMSMGFGSQSDKVVDAVTSWAKTGKTLQEATKLAESTMLLTKVGDIENIDTAQETLIAPLQAFNIEAEKSIELVDKYNNISNNMATTSLDVGQALAKSSSSMAIAGNTIDETIALIAVAESKTKQGGNAIGTALKTISLNLAEFKDSETGEPIPKLKDDLEKLGIQVVDTNGQIRSTFDILYDLSKIYGSLDKNTQLSLTNMIGSKRQANYVGAILSDTKELERAFNLASNSANSAMQEFEIYQESIQYSLDRLKEQMNQLYTNMVDDSFLKGVTELGVGTLGAVNQMVESFGLLPSALTIAGTAFLMFNKNANNAIGIMLDNTKGIGSLKLGLESFIESCEKQIDSIKQNISLQTDLAKENKKVGASTQGLGESLSALNIKLGLTEAKLIAAKIGVIGLQTAMSLGLSLAITGTISLLTKLGDELFNSKENLKEFNDEFINSSENNNVDKAQQLVDKYKAISEQLKVTTQGTEEYNTKQGELKATLDELVGVYPEAVTSINEDTKAKELNIGKTQELIDADKELIKAQANKVVSKNDLYSVSGAEQLAKNYDETKKKLKELNSMASKGIETTNVNGVQRSIQGEIDRTAKSLSEYESAIRASLPALKLLSEDNSSLLDVYNVLEGVIADSSSAMDSGTGSIDNYANSLDGLQGEIVSTTDQLKNMANEFGNLGSDIDILSKALEEFSENGFISADSMEKLLNTGDTELISLLADENTFLEKGNELLAQKKSLREEAMNSAIDLAVQEMDYQNSVLNNFAYNEQQKQNIANNTNQNVVNSTADAVNANKKNYKIDLTNKITAEREKTKSIADFVNANEEATTDMVNSLGDKYKTDTINFQNSLNDKTDMLKNWNPKIGNFTLGSRAGMGNKNKPTYDITKDPLFIAQQELNKVLSNYNKVQSNYNKVTASANKVGIGDIGKGSSSSKGGGNSSTQKEQKDIESLTDRYYNLKNALTDVENALKSLDIKMENATEEEKIKLLDQEIALLNKKRKALNDLLYEQRKEQNDLQYSLKTQGGFTFDSMGNITNYKQRMDELLKWANSSTDADAKKQAQETYKALEKMVDDYTKLVKNSITDTINQMDDITNEIIDSQKEISDILQKQRESYIKNLEKETDALKGELQKRKDLLSKQWKTEDEQDEIKSKQDKINQLEADLAVAIRTGDATLQKSIRDQLAEAQKELNEFIRDSERETANNRFDEEINKLDKELENKIDMINDKLGDEDILSLVQSGVRDLSDALGNIDKSTNGVNRTFSYVSGTVSNIGDIIGTTWINNMDKVIEKAKELSGVLSSDLDLNTNNVPKAKTINNGNSIQVDFGGINVNGLTKEEFRREVDKKIDEAYDRIMNEFRR